MIADAVEQLMNGDSPDVVTVDTGGGEWRIGKLTQGDIIVSDD